MKNSEMLTKLARDLLDTNNRVWSAAILQDCLNREGESLFRAMEEAGLYDVKTQDVSVVAGTEAYNLPADFALVVGKPYDAADVDTKYSPVSYEERYSAGDYAYYIIGEYKVDGATPTTSYAKIGVVEAGDTVARSFTLTVPYQPKWVDLSHDDDVPPIPADFHELQVLGARIRCMESKNMNTKEVEKMYSHHSHCE